GPAVVEDRHLEVLTGGRVPQRLAQLLEALAQEALGLLGRDASGRNIAPLSVVQRVFGSGLLGPAGKELPRDGIRSVPGLALNAILEQQNLPFGLFRRLVEGLSRGLRGRSRADSTCGRRQAIGSVSSGIVQYDVSLG